MLFRSEGDGFTPCLVGAGRFAEAADFDEDGRAPPPRRPWLAEGVAVMLADEHSGSPHPLFTPSVMMQIDEARELDYTAAGAFTMYLRERYGMALLLDYYATSANTDADAALVIFADVLGDSFADVEADYLAGGLPDTSGSLAPCNRVERYVHAARSISRGSPRPGARRSLAGVSTTTRSILTDAHADAAPRPAIHPNTSAGPIVPPAPQYA